MGQNGDDTKMVSGCGWNIFTAAFDFITFKKLAPESRLHSVGQKGCRTAAKSTHSFITSLFLLAQPLKRVQCFSVHSEIHGNRM